MGGTTGLGMDTAGARAHAARLRLAAREVEVLRDAARAAVGAATWHGPDGDALRARWRAAADARLSALVAALLFFAERLAAEADAQETASAPDVPEDSAAAVGDAGGARASRPGARSGDLVALDGQFVSLGPALSALLGGVSGRPAPPAPAPAPVPRMSLASVVADGIGWGYGLGAEVLVGTATLLGADPDGLLQARDDVGRVGVLLEGWVDGEGAPAVAELGAASLLAAGSVAVAPAELFTDTGFLDPRTDVTVHGMHAVPGPVAPRTLADLVEDGDEARRGATGPSVLPGADAASSGRIRVQQVRAADGTTGYIVHAPPTGGAPIWHADAWGAQGASAGWDSNLRAMAGTESAAMADVRAAMRTAGVPPGARVLLVGHSQGGLTAAQLAADPSFNAVGGVPGTYDVTHVFSVGSPVQTVVPVQSSTQVVNLAHDPVWAPMESLPGPARTIPLPRHIADPVPRLDLDGLRIDGSRATSPAVREAWLEAPTQTYGERSQLHNAHESVLRTSQGPDPTGGYHGTLLLHAGEDPVLAALQDDLEGRYLGEGVEVVSDLVVEVGREDLR